MKRIFDKYQKLIEAQAVELYLTGKMDIVPDCYHTCVYTLFVDIARHILQCTSGGISLVHLACAVRFLDIGVYISDRWSSRKIWKAYVHLKKFLQEEKVETVAKWSVKYYNKLVPRGERYVFERAQ
ncbi:MAG: hypothetical protein J7L51_03995 [Desulfurococcales archaeon]|nr:hypothetical protein [Desulfurococcales archaeon]